MTGSLPRRVLMAMLILPACHEGASVEAGRSLSRDDAAPGSALARNGETCAAFTAPPAAVPGPIAVPGGGGAVRLHAAAVGTQNYACTRGADGGGAWTFLGPSADLLDCDGTRIGHHFASDGGAAAPEWQLQDGTFVVGQKTASFTPDGAGGSVPWLLLRVVARGGSGPLSQAAYVQRLDTDGGVAPATGCAAGDKAEVPYRADYYFYAD